MSPILPGQYNLAAPAHTPLKVKGTYQMKIGFYDDWKPCIIKEDGVIDISAEVADLPNVRPQILLEEIIMNWDRLRPRLEQLASSGDVSGELAVVEGRSRALVEPAAASSAGERLIAERCSMRPRCYCCRQTVWTSHGSSSPRFRRCYPAAP